MGAINRQLLIAYRACRHAPRRRCALCNRMHEYNTHNKLPIKQLYCMYCTVALCTVNVRDRWHFCSIFMVMGVKRQWGCRKRQFSAFLLAIFRILSRWGQRYYMAICIPSSAFQWSQNAWPWMTLTGYFALNSVFAPVWLAETVRLRCFATH